MKLTVIIIGIIIYWCGGTCQVFAQKYRDAAACDLKGNVEMCIYYRNGKSTASYTFSSDGKWLTEDGLSVSDVYGVLERNSDGYIVKSDEGCKWLYDDYHRIRKYLEEGSYSIEYTYNEKGLIIKEVATDFNGGSHAQMIKTYSDFTLDSKGNWIKRRSSTDGYKDSWEARIISYYDAASSGTVRGVEKVSWNKLIGKRLILEDYGLIGSNGEEANKFVNNTDEYIMLKSNGILIWNNRQNGNTSYCYQIDGNKVRFGNTSGTKNLYFEIKREDSNCIKTHDNIGTYRYFRW